ncbi:MAG TPA: GNAT family protein [Acidimicrobiia bacterium]|jgi:RimJ/RimL family protein N-acetyltransferase
MARAQGRSDDEVELRPPTAADVDAIYAAVSESLPELATWMTWCHPGYARDETVDWVRSTEQAWTDDTEHAFVIVDRRDGHLLGGCGLNALDRLNRWANLGYWVRTSATGRGAATRAATLVADFGFAELGLDRIEILAATGNARSQRVAARVGAVREGVLRRRLHVNDVSHDAVVFSLIRDEWSGARDR